MNKFLSVLALEDYFWKASFLKREDEVVQKIKEVLANFPQGKVDRVFLNDELIVPLKWLALSDHQSPSLFLKLQKEVPQLGWSWGDLLSWNSKEELNEKVFPNLNYIGQFVGRGNQEFDQAFSNNLEVLFKPSKHLELQEKIDLLNFITKLAPEESSYISRILSNKFFLGAVDSVRASGQFKNVDRKLLSSRGSPLGEVAAEAFFHGGYDDFLPDVVNERGLDGEVNSFKVEFVRCCMQRDSQKFLQKLREGKEGLSLKEYVETINKGLESKTKKGAKSLAEILPKTREESQWVLDSVQAVVFPEKKGKGIFVGVLFYAPTEFLEELFRRQKGAASFFKDSSDLYLSKVFEARGKGEIASHEEFEKKVLLAKKFGADLSKANSFASSALNIERLINEDQDEIEKLKLLSQFMKKQGLSFVEDVNLFKEFTQKTHYQAQTLFNVLLDAQAIKITPDYAKAIFSHKTSTYFNKIEEAFLREDPGYFNKLDSLGNPVWWFFEGPVGRSAFNKVSQEVMETTSSKGRPYLHFLMAKTMSSDESMRVSWQEASQRMNKWFDRVDQCDFSYQGPYGGNIFHYIVLGTIAHGKKDQDIFYELVKRSKINENQLRDLLNQKDSRGFTPLDLFFKHLPPPEEFSSNRYPCRLLTEMMAYVDLEKSHFGKEGVLQKYSELMDRLKNGTKLKMEMERTLLIMSTSSANTNNKNKKPFKI